MAEWISISRTNVLTSDIASAICNNFWYLQDEVYKKEGKIVDVVETYMPYDTPIDEMMNKFNAVEQNITAIHVALSYSDPNYRNFTWTHETDLRKELHAGINRWIDWMNDVKRYFDGEVWFYLTDIDGKYIIDADGRYVIVQKRWE